MKVLFFIGTLSVGGAERQLVMLAAGLARRGHDVSILVLYGGGMMESYVHASGVRLLRIGKSGRWDVVWPLTRLFRVFLSERADVIYAFLPAQTALAGLLTPSWLKTRLVFGLRGGEIDVDCCGAIQALVYRLECWVSRRADLIIANAHAGRAAAIARGMSGERIAIIPNGIDLSMMAPDAPAGQAQRQAWGIAKDVFVIGMVARLDPMKDHPNFLDAAAAFARQHADARFVCVGGGTAAYRDDLRARARLLGLDKRVIWAGEVDALRSVYAAFDISTLSSRFGEGFPNAVGEAMSCGTPVVATDVGDTKELVGQCGEVVPPSSPALLSEAWTRMRARLQLEPDLQFRARARIAAHYGLDRMIATSEHVLAALCAGRSGRAIAAEFS